MSNELVTTALFGAGYTLRRVAQQLPRESIVLVCASSESAASLRSLGFRVEQLDCSVSRDLKDFFARYFKGCHDLKKR